jgi:hypothetical protein
VPAAAVIPAPIAYTNVVAVKKLVVGCAGGRGRGVVAEQSKITASRTPWRRNGDTRGVRLSSCSRGHSCYCEKIRVFQAVD